MWYSEHRDAGTGWVRPAPQVMTDNGGVTLTDRQAQTNCEQALAQAERWLDEAQRERSAQFHKTNERAELIYAYASAADTWVRLAELRAALDGKIVPEVETYDQRYVAASNSIRRSEAEGDLDEYVARALSAEGRE